MMKSVYAIPTATIIPSIGPIIGQITLFVISALMFSFSKIKKFRYNLIIFGLVTLGAGVIWMLLK